MIDINKTELSEQNYTEFMDVLDGCFLDTFQGFHPEYRHSETMSKEQWLLDCHGATVSDIVNAYEN